MVKCFKSKKKFNRYKTFKIFTKKVKLILREFIKTFLNHSSISKLLFNVGKSKYYLGSNIISNERPKCETFFPKYEDGN